MDTPAYSQRHRAIPVIEPILGGGNDRSFLGECESTPGFGPPVEPRPHGASRGLHPSSADSSFRGSRTWRRGSSLTRPGCREGTALRFGMGSEFHMFVTGRRSSWPGYGRSTWPAVDLARRRPQAELADKRIHLRILFGLGVDVEQRVDQAASADAGSYADPSASR